MKLPFELTIHNIIIAVLVVLLVIVGIACLFLGWRYHVMKAQSLSHKLNQDFNTSRVVIEKEYITPAIADLTTDDRTRAMSNAWEVK